MNQWQDLVNQSVPTKEDRLKGILYDGLFF